MGQLERVCRWPVPGVGQGAIQMDRFVAEVIRQDLGKNVDPKGRPAFAYYDKGSMATVDRGEAVASIGRFSFGGFLGWLAWGLVHILFLIGFAESLWCFLSGSGGTSLFEKGNRLIAVIRR